MGKTRRGYEVVVSGHDRGRNDWKTLTRQIRKSRKLDVFVLAFESSPEQKKQQTKKKKKNTGAEDRCLKKIFVSFV